MLNTLINHRYHIENELGKGGMGVVYRSHDTVIKRDVAIKVISPSSLGTDGQARLLREARTAGQLNHPNIVSIFDVGEIEGTPYVVMELVDGKSLRDYPDLTIEEKVEILRQICEALQHAHASGIIHRDLKPENTMITSDGTAKLLDFGLARTADDIHLTVEVGFVGTIAYMAPEVLLGGEASIQSDLYALGVLMYEVFTGRQPFRGDDIMAVISQHLHSPVIPPGSYSERIPGPIQEIILKLLEKAPADRPKSAADVLNVLGSNPNILTNGDSVSDTSNALYSSGQAHLLDRIVRGRLIGREKEFSDLKAFWLRSISDKGHLVLLSGEPGIGKTRLARELGTYAQLTGALVLKGEFQAQMDTPYSGFREAFREYLHSHSEEEIRTKTLGLESILCNLLPELDQIFPDLTTLSPIDWGKEDQLRLLNAVVSLIKRFTEDQPVLLLLEDLQWADKASLKLLHHMLRGCLNVPLLVLGTYREVNLDLGRPFYETLIGLNRERLYTRISLKRLDSSAVEKFLEVLLDGPVDSELSSRIYRETDGNPFFVEEVVKSLIRRGAIRRENDGWIPNTEGDFDVPQSIQIAIGKQMIDLTSDTVNLLRQSSIIGRQFSVDVLISLLKWDELRVLDCLEEAEGAQMIMPLPGDREERYQFVHALVAQVLYEGISLRRRMLYHFHVAEALEQVYQNRPGQVVESMVHHYALASQKGVLKAAKYGLLAAEKAEKVFAYDQAIEHYNAVLDSYTELGDLAGKASVWAKIGAIWARLNHIVNAKAAFQTAVQHYEDAGLSECEESMRAELLLASFSDSASSKTIIETLVANPNFQKYPELVSKARIEISRFLRSNGFSGESLLEGQKALSLAEKTDKLSLIAEAWGNIAYAQAQLNNLDAYREAIQKQLVLLDQAEDLSGMFGAIFDGIGYYATCGDLNSAEKIAANGLSFCQRSNTPGWEGTILAAYIGVLEQQGKWDEALERSSRVIPLMESVGVSSCFLFLLRALASIEHGRGNHEQAEIYHQKLLDILLQFKGITEKSLSYLQWHFIVLAYRERWEEAWQVYEQVLDMGYVFKGAVFSREAFWGWTAPVVAARTAHFEEAQRVAKHYQAWLSERKVKYGLVDYARGIAEAGLGNNSTAFHAFQTALETFEKSGEEYNIGLVKLELGKLMREMKQSSNGDHYLQAAQEIFSQIRSSTKISEIKRLRKPV